MEDEKVVDYLIVRAPGARATDAGSGEANRVICISDGIHFMPNTDKRCLQVFESLPQRKTRYRTHLAIVSSFVAQLLATNQAHFSCPAERQNNKQKYNTQTIQ